MVDRTELLDAIDPKELDYSDWLMVGQALHQEGASWEDWDDWSQRDPARYKDGECERKWSGFGGSGNPVTGGSLFYLAKELGWSPEIKRSDELLDWDSEISIEASDIKPVVDRSFLSGIEIKQPNQWKPVDQAIEYIETLFESDEYVGYVEKSISEEAEGKIKYKPANSGVYYKTAGELIDSLQKYRSSLGNTDDAIRYVFGDYDSKAGMWIRFNPLDGNGVGNRNVTVFRYTLVESDELEVEKQYEILKTLELPIATLVHSGGKSLHAIVKVDASTEKQYQERVRFIYDVCEKNGLKLDKNNKNSSRLSRLPGINRGSNKQFLVATNIGKADFSEWKEYQEELNDSLPDIENFEEVYKKGLPELAPELIKGILRKGHKYLLAGPAKAGKSFALIELAIAIANGSKWFDRWECAKGKVLYINLEVDSASCLGRFDEVYKTLEIENYSNLDIWNLRGESLPLDKLVPKLVRRAKDKKYSAIIIDPIYKVITGDENSAEQMALFCNQFDKICKQLGCSAIYCHHHSKGAAANSNAANRASGSGVFQRDPDAASDLVELRLDDVPEEVRAQVPDGATVWRMETTVREFASPNPIEIVFEYPRHWEIEGFEDAKNKYGVVDKQTAGKRANEDRASRSKANAMKLVEFVESKTSFDEVDFVSVKEACEYFGVARTTIYGWVDKQPEIYRDAGRIYLSD